MHAKRTIYADYQATTPVDPRVVEKMAPHWCESFGNPHSSDHVVGWQAAKTVAQSKTAVAGLIGADPDEIIFTSGATEANNLALFGLARRAPAGRRRILVGAAEHKCVLAAARALAEREGFTVEQIPVDREGFIDLDALAAKLDENTLVVSIMAVNNEVGTIQDVPRIAEIVGTHGVLFHCDAAQAPCALDMREMTTHADLISLATKCTGRRASARSTSGGMYRSYRADHLRRRAAERPRRPCPRSTSGEMYRVVSSRSSTAEGSRATCAPAPSLSPCASAWRQRRRFFFFLAQ